MSFFYYSTNQYQPPLQYYPYTSPQYYSSSPSPQYYPTPTQYYIQYVYPTPPTPPAQTQSITVPKQSREQSLLQELNTLDEAYFVHNYISKKEYEEYRQKVINKWRGKLKKKVFIIQCYKYLTSFYFIGQEKKSFWNRMWDTACRCGNFIFKNLLTSIISNLGSSLIGGFTGHSGFIGQ
ncbi:hypothetical protein RhiirC2_101036 [Rhizophagus irregularis]|uniref:Uncharacterized protein n=1 Tax=Rhizophagus irregularis TaxID=588596 RepID=A0A2N1NTQ7_9GLOM|nr:hypothetical protein RhiirC2_101036 [Rhizophagus irregularis]